MLSPQLRKTKSLSGGSLSSQGALAVVVTAFLWSTAGLFIKLIDWQPFAIAGLRSLIASILLLMVLRRPKFHFSFAQIVAGVANAATMLLFVVANKTTTAANAILLQYMAPVLTALLGAVLLKERIHGEHWGAFGVVAAGMVVLFMDKLGGGQTLGNLLAIASAFTFAIFFVFMRKQKDGSPLESMLLSHLITAVAGIGISLFMPIPVFTPGAVGAIFALGVVQIGVAGILFSYGIKRITAVSAGLISVIEPVFNPVWVFLVIGERPSINAIVGGSMIIGAVTVASVIGARRSGERAAAEQLRSA